MKKTDGNIKERIKSIKGFLKGSETLLKDVENLTSKIYNDNLSNLKSFKDVLAIVDKKLITKIPNPKQALKVKSPAKEVEIIKKNDKKDEKDKNDKKDKKDKKVINLLIEKIKDLENNQSKLLEKLNEQNIQNQGKRFV